MPKVINQDDIDKIAEYKERGYSISAIARELGLDRTTVRKYSPQEEKPEEEKAEQPTPQLSLEEEFCLVNKKVETDHELKSLLDKISDYEWETESLEARAKVAFADIDFLKKKLG